MRSTLPKPDITGIQTFLFAAWDQTAGVNGGTADAYQRGGNTAISSNILTARIDVTPVT